MLASASSTSFNEGCLARVLSTQPHDWSADLATIVIGPPSWTSGNVSRCLARCFSPSYDFATRMLSTRTRPKDSGTAKMSGVSAYAVDSYPAKGFCNCEDVLNVSQKVLQPSRPLQSSHRINRHDLKWVPVVFVIHVVRASSRRALPREAPLKVGVIMQRLRKFKSTNEMKDALVTYESSEMQTVNQDLLWSTCGVIPRPFPGVA